MVAPLPLLAGPRIYFRCSTKCSPPAAWKSQSFTAVNFLFSIIPTTLVSAFAEGKILQVLFISVLVGAALCLAGSRGSKVLGIIVEGQDILFRIMGFIMRLAPLGAFGAMAATIGAFGMATLLHLAKLVALYWLSCLFFVVHDAIPFARALVEAAPTRVLWGTDWPHPNIKGPVPKEDELLALLRLIAPEPELLKAILSDNPNHLYGFDVPGLPGVRSTSLA